MDKKIIYFSLALILIFSMAWVVNAFSSTDFTNVGPANASANSSTNSTQQFIFNFVNGTNISASCTLYFDSVAVASNSSVMNNTNTALYSNTSLGSDGRHTWFVNCTNGTTIQFPTQEFILDTTNPTASNLHAPTSSYNTSNASVTITVSGADAIGNYYDNARIKINVTVDGSVNKTLYAYGNSTQVTYVDTFADGLHQWNATVYDNSTNSRTSVSDYFRVDTTAPVLAGYVVNNLTSGYDYIARINFTSIDAQLPVHSAYAYFYYTNSSNTSSVTSNVKSGVIYGTLTQNTTGLSIMNQIDFAGTDVPNDGVFIIEPHANDTLANDRIGTNQTNWTKTTLYAGWNMISIDRNTSMSNISNWSTQITKVSFWNISGASWINYVDGAATNAAQAVMDGDAVYVYATSTTYLMRKWSFDNGNLMNMSYAKGWNQVSVWNSTMQLFQSCTQLVPSNASASVIAVSYYDASDSSYKTQNCAIKTGWNNNYTIVRGKSALWFNLNTTSSVPIRR